MLRPGCNTPGGLEWLAAGCFGPSPGASGSILDETDEQLVNVKSSADARNVDIR